MNQVAIATYLIDCLGYSNEDIAELTSDNKYHLWEELTTEKQKMDCLLFIQGGKV